MKRLALTLLFATLLCLTSRGESDTLRFVSMEEVRLQNVWLNSDNPTKLSLNRFNRFSIAQTEATYLQGGFGVTGLPHSTDTYLISAESFQRLGRTTLYGLLGYAQHRHREQNWNSMSGEAWLPLNFADSIPGCQRAEEYHLAGSISLPLDDRWIVGAAFQYQVQLTAKDTDPRNRNQWMEWQFTPGVSYRVGSLRWGASFRYVASQESVKIRNIGQHQVYPIFAVYPLSFFRAWSQEGEVNGYYSAHRIGAALQAHLTRESFQLFQQFSTDIFNQQVESNRIQNRSEGEADGWQAAYIGTLQQQQGDTHQEWKAQTTLYHTRSYDPLQHQANGSVWQTDSRVLRSTRQAVDATLTYRYGQMYNATHLHHSLEVGVGYHQGQTTLLFYPIEYSQPIYRFTAQVTFCRQIALSKGATLDFSIRMHGQIGGGTALCKRSSNTGQEAPEVSLWDNEILRKQTFDYETGPRWGIIPTVAYTRPLPPSISGSWFIRLKGGYEHAYRLPKTDGKEIVVQIGWLF